MAIYLDEDYIGSHQSEIIFPHLLLCMGVVCQLGNGRLVGCHISGSGTEDLVLAELAAQIGSDPGNPVRLYMIADYTKHFLHSKLSFTDKAEKIGYSGDILVIDTAGVVSNDGAFARVVSGGGGAPCTVYILDDRNARPYSLVSGKSYAGGGHIAEIVNGAPAPARWIKTSDSAARNIAAVAQNDIRLARVN